MYHSPCHDYEHDERDGAPDGLQIQSALEPKSGSGFLEKTLGSVLVDAKELSERWPDLCNQTD
jgi:hypothetical protein